MLIGLWYRLIRFGFRLLYNELAWTYDLVSWSVSLGHWRRWQQTAIGQLATFDSKRSVLELAHGTADLQVDFAAAGISSIGLDYSKYMGTLARHKLQKKMLPAKLVRGSGLQLPFPIKTFSAVVSTFPTEFIFRDDTIREIFRVLEDDGKLIIVMSGSLAPANAIVKFIEWLYMVTGQNMTISDQYTAPFRLAGFDAEIKKMPVGTDTVVMLSATKPNHKK